MSKPETPQCFLIGLQPRVDSAFLPTDVASRRCGLNTGNLVASFALCSHLDFPEVVDIGAPLRQMNRSGRVGVVQGANQLGAHFNGGRWFQPITEVEIGLTLVGVGVQGPLTESPGSGQEFEAEPVADDVPPDAFDWIARIAERAPTAAANIGVRGNLTQAVLAEHGFGGRFVEVIGCPSLFINPNPRLGGEIAARAGTPERIAVLAGNTAWQGLQPIEETLAGLVGKSGSYIGQHGMNMMKITRGEAEQLSKEDLQKCRNYIRPRLNSDDFKAWCNVHGNLFFDVPAWLEHYRRFDFVVGLRLHGAVLALQAGVPALCIAHDARMLELCRTMRIPHVLPAQIERGISVQDLYQLATFDADAFDANRRALCRKYVDFLRGNGLTAVQWLEDLAAPIPVAKEP